jgi:hypothetical protein
VDLWVSFGVVWLPEFPLFYLLFFGVFFFLTGDGFFLVLFF